MRIIIQISPIKYNDNSYTIEYPHTPIYRNIFVVKNAKHMQETIETLHRDFKKHNAFIFIKADSRKFNGYDSMMKEKKEIYSFIKKNQPADFSA